MREKQKDKSVDVRTFYEEGNSEAQAAREDASERGMAEMCDWLRKGGQIALLDATHGSLGKREKVGDRSYNSDYTLHYSSHYRVTWFAFLLSG